MLPSERSWVPSCLTEQHDFSGFSCGEESLDRWLRNEATAAQRSGASRTHVWTAPDDKVVRAYFTITPTTVRPAGLSKRQLGGLNGDVPGYLLAKLALCVDLRGSKPRFGPELLVDALEVILTAADAAGGRLIVVDTMNERAHDFYRRANFQPIPDTRRLVMRVATAREALGR